MRILDGLDPEQRQVATALEGPVVVVAGAGTGKTRAMTHRLAYGVATGAFAPTSVLAVTFTTRAAGELRGRLRALGVEGVQARTFHSAALRQAQYFWPRAYGSALPPIADNKMGIVAEAVRREGLKPDTGLLRDIAGEVSWAKVSNVSPTDYPAVAEAAGRSIAGQTPAQVSRLLARYEAVKQSRGVLDFDDILLCDAALLAEFPDVAHEVRRQYRHFVVDEYQDVSPLQQALLDLWRGDSDDVCVVGDPSQTIHSFAGARAEYLTGFQQRHPNALRIELVRDYRSTPQVVGLANGVMKGQAHVELVAQRAAGPEPVLVSAPSEASEAATVAAWLAARAAAGVPYHEMAVLYRIHAQSPAFEAALADAGIPFATRGAEGFFERGEVKQALRAFDAHAKASGDEPANHALRGVLAGLGWTIEPPSGQGSVRERWESWSALVNLGDDFAQTHPEATASDLAAELEIRARAKHAPSGQAVTLSTLHGAKGLEWEAVALVGMQEGSLPFVLATSPEQVAEERRLLYVGITRAKQHLHISWSVTRNGGGARRAVSRFLADRVPQAATDAAPTRRRSRQRGSAMSKNCRVCGRGLNSGSERKLGRHLDCPVTHDEELWEELRAWRKKTADEASVPAFVVFTDATLMAIVEQTPSTLDELSQISGVGARKLERYGEAVLEVLAQHS